MPRGDRTGPRGLGPMTGRRMGYCAGYATPGFANPGPGYGLGLGRGRNWGGGGGGRGWRHWYYATGLPGWARFAPPAYGPPAYGAPAPPVTKDEEVTWLRNQAKVLQDQLDAINKRLGELESET